VIAKRKSADIRRKEGIADWEKEWGILKTTKIIEN
jgi:hypothetical protein